MSDENNKQKDSKLGIRQYVFLSIVVVLIWGISITTIYYIFPDWTSRGGFGDTFGAVNALFSGLALAGIVYALLLQRAELGMQREELRMNREVMRGQLDEMRSSRQVQSQPLVIPTKAEFRIERPRFFYTPPDDEYSAMSRYFVKFPISNPTEYPAVVVNCRASIHTADSDYKESVFGATDSFLDVLVPLSSNDNNTNMMDFMFVGDEKGLLFDSLRQPDPRRVPIITAKAFYKNIVGAQFQVTQIFQVYPSENTELLRSWHSSVASFAANFKVHICELRKLKAKNESEWDISFDEVKDEFDKGLISEDDGLNLYVREAPGGFQVKQISSNEYDKALGKTSYSVRMTDNFDCPSEIDSENEKVEHA